MSTIAPLDAVHEALAELERRGGWDCRKAKEELAHLRVKVCLVEALKDAVVTLGNERDELREELAAAYLQRDELRGVIRDLREDYEELKKRSTKRFEADSRLAAAFDRADYPNFSVSANWPELRAAFMAWKKTREPEPEPEQEPEEE